MGDYVHLWQWLLTDDFGKRRVFRCRLTEEDAKHYKDAEKMEGSPEFRKPLGSTSAWQTSPRSSTPGSTTNARGSSSDTDNSRS